jgi:hypothetical protein
MHCGGPTVRVCVLCLYDIVAVKYSFNNIIFKMLLRRHAPSGLRRQLVNKAFTQAYYFTPFLIILLGRADPWDRHATQHDYQQREA